MRSPLKDPKKQHSTQDGLLWTRQKNCFNFSKGPGQGTAITAPRERTARDTDLKCLSGISCIPSEFILHPKIPQGGELAAREWAHGCKTPSETSFLKKSPQGRGCCPVHRAGGTLWIWSPLGLWNHPMWKGLLMLEDRSLNFPQKYQA